MKKQELEHGKWYKLLHNGYPNCILQFNKEDIGPCIGYWDKTWGVSWGFPLNYDWELATYEELEELGAKHREHYTFSLEDLANGVCSLKNDGTEEELQLVLDKAFPNFKKSVSNYMDDDTIAYQKTTHVSGEWIYMLGFECKNILPMQSCAVFLEEIYRQKPLLPSECFKGGMNLDTKPETFEPSYAGNIREFETGSKRDDDSDKPLVNHLDAYLRLRFGYLLRQGANKYDKGNWKKGQPTETALESLHRHLAKYELNLQNGVEQDEDHLSAVLFNVMLILKNEEKDGIEANHYYGTLK